MTTVVTCKFCCLPRVPPSSWHTCFTLLCQRASIVFCFDLKISDHLVLISRLLHVIPALLDSCFFKLSLFYFPLYLLTSELLVFFLRSRIILIIILYFFFVVVKCCQENSDSWVSSEQHPAWVWVLLARHRQTVSAIMFLSLKRSE